MSNLIESIAGALASVLVLSGVVIAVGSII